MLSKKVKKGTLMREVPKAFWEKSKLSDTGMLQHIVDILQDN